jgi:hypothetical protein
MIFPSLILFTSSVVLLGKVLLGGCGFVHAIDDSLQEHHSQVIMFLVLFIAFGHFGSHLLSFFISQTAVRSREAPLRLKKTLSTTT